MSLASPQIESWSKDAFLAKAIRYAEEMRAHQHDDWRFGFWSSLMLELLARASLAHVSPALLADCKDWHNLFFALGQKPKAAKFTPRSIDTKTVLSRLNEVIEGFSSQLKDFCILHLERRNEELHAGSTPFEGSNTSEWLAQFYEAADVLLNSIEESLESIFTEEESKTARNLITAAKDESAKVVAKRIEAHRTIWTAKPQDEREKLLSQSTLWASRHIGHRVTCPGCGSPALVTGLPTSAPVRKLENGFIVERQNVLPERFECVACGLKIAGLAQLHACKLADSYTMTNTYDPIELYALQDEYEGYEPDNNEP